MLDVAANVARVRERIAAAARRSGRRAEDVTVVAITKGVDPPQILAAAACGITEIGENRVQEAVPKIAVLRAAHPAPSLRWHMVGHLQRNKVRAAARSFNAVHSVDSADLGRALSAQIVVQPDRTLDVLIQVNISGEPQKFGIAPAVLPALLRDIVRLPGLRVIGLMTIAPQADDPQTVRPVFSRLRRLRDEAARLGTAPGLVHLSMGMSDDFEVAVEEGATFVRIGRSIFGGRTGHSVVEYGRGKNDPGRRESPPH